MKKVIEIDEKRFVALAELGMAVTLGAYGEHRDAIWHRLTSKTLDLHTELRLLRTVRQSNNLHSRFWTLVEANE